MTTTDWAIPQQAKLKYTQLFNLHDRTRTGFLSGLQCRDILMQSALPRNTLAEIWNLSDIDGDGQLTREEFILAMHLTNQVRAGNQLPQELPSDLIPPSYRKPRSISTTSIQSASSAASSTPSTNANQSNPAGSAVAPGIDELRMADTAGSVLNTNSFENKRRENFEKGRAELERRRLKMIESQIHVLGDQLASGKKQVADAKAKIDAMRSDRDAKAGLITSLEAQLQTVRDRRAFLQHEEQNLIAIAKDLNLVDPTQSNELDQRACKEKQDSINEMKQKLIELQREKEEKAKELTEATRILEDSKNEFKTISDDVSKVYQDYKEKLANAIVMRDQLAEENKSKPISLDAAWDAAPSSYSPSVKSATTTNTGAAVPSDTFGDSSQDPWASSSATQSTKPSATNDPFAFNEPAVPVGNNLDTDSKNNNDTSTNFNEPRDYSAFGEISQKTATQNDEFSSFTKSNDIVPDAMHTKRKYKALYAFEARNPDELDINPGDIIVGSEIVCEPGWLSGERNGKSGLFPESYVEEIFDVALPTSDQSVAVAEVIPAKSSVQQIQPAPGSIVKYRVLYAFDARNVDELTINPGDIVTGIEGAHEPGWLMGELSGQRGLFPEAYVEQLTVDTNTDQLLEQQQQSSEQPAGTLRRGSSSGSLRSKKSRAKKAEVATVVANYRALGQEQLNLEKGQLVMIRRKMDSGWWEGELQIKDKSEFDYLISELMDSERDYVDDLRLCQSTYIIPLSSSFDVSQIFNNWNQLIQLHDTSLSKLTETLDNNNVTATSSQATTSNQRERNKMYVLESFQKLLESIIKPYIQFCSSQNESMLHLKSKIASDIRFKQMVNECQRRLSAMVEKQIPLTSPSDGVGQESRAAQNVKLPLVSFILKPMQRITKYSLIFERMSKLVVTSSPSGGGPLKNQVDKIHASAQLLCQRVNGACRLKEDELTNANRLRWCQSHIKQIVLGTGGSAPYQAIQNNSSASTYMDSLSSNRSHTSASSQSTDLSVSIQSGQSFIEHIQFDSMTNCQGKRKLIKTSSLIKLKSGRELVAFLFNDLLLLTQLKSGATTSSLRITEDLFKSERAQQAYYKVYRQPILLSDLLVQDPEEALADVQLLLSSNSFMMCRPSSLQLISPSIGSNNSSSNASPISSNRPNQTTDHDTHQQTLISFVDQRSGGQYNLLALSSKDQASWFNLLTSLSLEARKAAALAQKQVSPLTDLRLKVKRLSVSECSARLFVTILSLHVSQTSSKLKRAASSMMGHHQQAALSGDGSPEVGHSQRSSIMLSSFKDYADQTQPIDPMLLIRMQMQLRRYGRSIEVGTTDQRPRIEITPLSDHYKTKTVCLSNLDNTNNTQVVTSEPSDQSNGLQAHFDNESAQFLIAADGRPNLMESTTSDTTTFGTNCDSSSTSSSFKSELLGDYLELELISDYRFRQNLMIAKKRISIDELLGGESKTKPIIDLMSDPLDKINLNRSQSMRSTIQALVPNRPVEINVRLKSINDLAACSIQMDNPSFRRSFASPKRSLNPIDPVSVSTIEHHHQQKYKLTLRLRLHLQLFSENQ